MLDKIANEMMIASRILQTNNVSNIASEIGYRPMLVISACYFGHESGKFVWDRKKDIITISEDIEVESLQPTEGLLELQEQIELFVGYLNQDEKDISHEELQLFLANSTPELHIKMAVFTSKKLASYELIDPKDKKSQYTFITMRENSDKLWGQKQFDPKKSKARRAGKK